jgi:hypothetical protein
VRHEHNVIRWGVFPRRERSALSNKKRNLHYETSQILLSTSIGLLALAGLSYGSYRGYSAYKADPKGFKKQTRRLVEDAVDAYTEVKEQARR